MTPYKQKFYAELSGIVSELRLSSGAYVLDCACARGKFTHLFLDKDLCYVGVDIDEVALATARERYDSYQNVSFILASILNLEESLERRFSLVCCTHTIEHLGSMANKRIAVKQLVDRLDFDGLLVLQCPTRTFDGIKDDLLGRCKKVRAIYYRGWISNLLEILGASKLSQYWIWRLACRVLAKFDFGSRDCIVVFRKL